MGRTLLDITLVLAFSVGGAQAAEGRNWNAQISGRGRQATAAISVSLVPSISSPAPVGTMVTWNAIISPADPGTLWYRFRARRLDREFRMIRDYGPSNWLNWTASQHEGTYELELSVRDRETGDTVATSVLYEFTSRVTGGTPVISPTSNPLVFLYSAPACPAGSAMRVQFRSPEGVVESTPFKACQPGLSMNFYLAGMRPNTDYVVKHTVATGFDSQDGPEMTLTTSDAPVELPAQTVLTGTPATDGILLHCPINGVPFATDLSGNLVWFYPEYISELTRPAPGGFFAGVIDDSTQDQSHQMVREFDLAGMTVRETNAARVNEQLVAMGKRPISSFHHEAGRLPDGKLLALALVEQILTDVQGPGPVNVLGDMILVLDRDLQVVWAWDAFDHLDPGRMAVLGETCTPGTGGCAPFYLAPQANDWLHGNSVHRTPDGNLLYSIRHQDWVIKIDYDHGYGSGEVLWRLGKDGDFQFDSPDPYPWFSHQHDAEFEFRDNSTLTLFDNGNTRRFMDPTANSRGQVIRLDEANRIASFILNADLGGYSFALGAAQKLRNGNYQFTLGALAGAARTVEVDPSGNAVYALGNATLEYRAFRMANMYTPF